MSGNGFEFDQRINDLNPEVERDGTNAQGAAEEFF